MIRKAGKLPGVLVSSGEYVTEYSTDETVMRFGAINESDRVVLIDDLIATGGTALAGFELCDQLGARVHEFAAMIELPFLNGVKKIHEYKDGKFKDVPCFTVVDSLTIGGICGETRSEMTCRGSSKQRRLNCTSWIARAGKLDDDVVRRL